MRTAIAATAHAYSSATTVAALERRLEELVEMLMTINVEAYLSRPASPVSGSIGEHVRHALDHVSALVSANPSFELSYDHRERNTRVEIDPDAALRRVFQLQAGLERWASELSDAPVRVVTQLSASGDTAAVWSTFGRELAFVISHTIHHQAIIAVLLAWQGIGVPHSFGYAPSTPRTT